MGLLINLLDDISKQQYVEKGKNYLRGEVKNIKCSIVSACHNSYDKTQANGRMKNNGGKPNACAHFFLQAHFDMEVWKSGKMRPLFRPTLCTQNSINRPNRRFYLLISKKYSNFAACFECLTYCVG